LIKSSPARFDLIVSGHTHGGQLALFGWAPFTPAGSGRFVSGEYVTPLGRLYVTRGLGTSLLPIRLGSRPELVFITVV
jgi:predicted MPP superfamily phosphohydrolase